MAIFQNKYIKGSENFESEIRDKAVFQSSIFLSLGLRGHSLIFVCENYEIACGVRAQLIWGS